MTFAHTHTFIAYTCHSFTTSHFLHTFIHCIYYQTHTFFTLTHFVD